MTRSVTLRSVATKDLSSPNRDSHLHLHVGVSVGSYVPLE